MVVGVHYQLTLLYAKHVTTKKCGSQNIVVVGDSYTNTVCHGLGEKSRVLYICSLNKIILSNSVIASGVLELTVWNKS